MVERIQEGIDRKNKPRGFKGKLLSVDSTTIDLCLSLYPWARFHHRKGAVKIHTVLDHDGLACLVERELGQSPLSGDYFIFVNRVRDRLKILFWDNCGFCLFCKRLEQGRFPVPDTCDGLVERSALSLMLDGITVKESKKLPRYTP